MNFDALHVAHYRRIVARIHENIKLVIGTETRIPSMFRPFYIYISVIFPIESDEIIHTDDDNK